MDTSLSCPCCMTLSTVALPGAVYSSCRCCDHQWRLPTGKAGDAGYYQALVARNDISTPWFRRKLDERLDTLLTLKPAPQRLLEVGCAEGELGAALKRHLQLTYEGIELSQDAEAASRQLDRVFRIPADQLSDRLYDLILSFHVLEHLPDPLAELQAWSRLLNEHGRILLEVPHRSGHPLLVEDLNAEHLHQFTPASLTVLLSRAGFTCTTLSLGHYESPVYPDSIRVLASATMTDEQRRASLVSRFKTCVGGPFIAYGIGGDFLNYVQPLAQWLDIRALVDSSPHRQGQRVGDWTISTYDPQQHGAWPILICSIRFSREIRRQLIAAGISTSRIIGLEDIYGQT